MTGRAGTSRLSDRLWQAVPLFVRIGLLWWVVLFAYPLSRPWLLYRLDLSMTGKPDGNFIDLPIVVLGLLSLAHALLAAWVGVRLLQWRGCGRTVWSLLAWAAGIAWFAPLTWGLVIAAARFFDMSVGDSLGQRSTRFLELLFASVAVIPWVALTSFWKATWLVLPLAIVSVLIVRRTLARAESSASPAGAAST